MTAGATRRVFVGLAPERSVAEGLAAAAAGVLDPSLWRVHAARDIHLTLCFVGPIAAERYEELAVALHRDLDGLRAPEIEIAATGAFPAEGGVRALWAGVRGAAEEMQALGDLQRAAGSAIRSVGLSWDERPVFTPHLTLARPRGSRAMVEEFARLAFEYAWRPTEVCLFDSMGGAGDRYPRRGVARLRQR